MYSNIQIRSCSISCTLTLLCESNLFGKLVNMATRSQAESDDLLVIGWIRLFTEKKFKNVPTEIKLICKDFFGINYGIITNSLRKTDINS